MPELPEVETTILGIKPYLIGEKVRDVVIRYPTLRFPIPSNLASLLRHKTIKDITRLGKYILCSFEHGTLIMHLGMSGRMRILTNPQQPLKHDHCDIILTNGITLRFNDPRRFGAILWQEGLDPRQHPLLKNLGIEPLSRQLNSKYLAKLANNKKIAVKSFIMDSKNLVGVGNIYATESLFLAHIHPLKPAGKISQQEWHRLATSIKTVLRLAVKAGGTTFRDFAAPDGTIGYFTVQLHVYGKAGLPCPRCGTKLKSVRISQRSTVYCPHCQRR